MIVCNQLIDQLWLIDWLIKCIVEEYKMAEKVGGGTPYAEAVLEVNI